MDLINRFGIGHQASPLDHLLGERLLDMGQAGFLEDVEELAHLTAGDTSTTELLCEGIDGHEPSTDLLRLRLIIDLGMGDAVGAVEVDGLAEDDVHTPLSIEMPNGREGAEPYQLDRPRTVGEVTHEALLSPFAYLLEVSDIAL